MTKQLFCISEFLEGLRNFMKYSWSPDKYTNGRMVLVWTLVHYVQEKINMSDDLNVVKKTNNKDSIEDRSRRLSKASEVIQHISHKFCSYTYSPCTNSCQSAIWNVPRWVSQITTHVDASHDTSHSWKKNSKHSEPIVAFLKIRKCIVNKVFCHPPRETIL